MLISVSLVDPKFFLGQLNSCSLTILGLLGLDVLGSRDLRARTAFLFSSTFGLNVFGMKLNSESLSTTTVWAMLKVSMMPASPLLNTNGSCEETKCLLFERFDQQLLCFFAFQIFFLTSHSPLQSRSSRKKL